MHWWSGLFVSEVSVLTIWYIRNVFNKFCQWFVLTRPRRCRLSLLWIQPPSLFRLKTSPLWYNKLYMLKTLFFQLLCSFCFILGINPFFSQLCLIRTLQICDLNDLFQNFGWENLSKFLYFLSCRFVTPYICYRVIYGW